MEDYGTPISDLPKKIQELLAVWSDLEYKEKMWFLGLDDARKYVLSARIRRSLEGS